jgi:glycerophosphoryl diester phosphodiesterase
MAEPRAFWEGFCHSRIEDPYPELPPGYDWGVQIRKYCPEWYYGRLANAINTRHQYERFYKRYIPDGKPKPDESTDVQFGAVFCHRAFYDRALKIPENSTRAIENGIDKGLLLHELDARLGSRSGQGQTYLAHDEHARRVTSKNERWSKLSITEILNTALAIRRFDLVKNDFASSFEDTNENVPDLEKLLHKYSDGTNFNRKTDQALFEHARSCTFQIDLRGNDFARAIAWFRRRESHAPKLLLKGYNLTFPNGSSLRTAVESIAKQEYGERFNWEDLNQNKLPLIMVFYSQPIIDLALKAIGKDPGDHADADRLNLRYEHLLNITQTHVLSFVEIAGRQVTNQISDTKVDPVYPLLIPEIVHSGLGLGYDIRTGTARNPLDGSLITDPETILSSRLDRAMIEVSLRLKEMYPTMVFSGCTRLCEVRTPDGKELTASMKTGELREKPQGPRGLPAKLRAYHGGLYPRSDLVVADDPLAEIAARTWIDEYAKLDRSKLLDPNINYDDWLKTAGRTVYRAVNKLQGPFRPNTFGSPLNDGWVL